MSFFQKAKYVLLKNSFRGIFVSKLRVSLLATYLQKWGIYFQFFQNFTERISQLSHDSFTRSSFPQNMSCAFEPISRVTSRELYPRNEWIFNYIGQIVLVFLKLIFCLFRASLNLKHHFHSKLNQTSKDFISKTHLRYVLSFFPLLNP